MRLFWHATSLAEAEWLRYMLGDLVTSEAVDLGFSGLYLPGIHVINENVTPLQTLPLRKRGELGGRDKVVLVHLSDEWFRGGGYTKYAEFDYVIRNYWTHLASGPGIMTIPLGYPNGTPTSATAGPPVGAGSRPHLWSFVGQIKASRGVMARTLRTLERGILVDTRPGRDAPLSKADFNALLENSVFGPCPMGNITLETWRLYECLERGVIPILEKRIGLNYFENVVGSNHPIPAFRTWRAARHFCAGFRDAPEAAERLQTDLTTWWAIEKARIRAELHQELNGAAWPLSPAPHGAQAVRRSSLIYEALRLFDLLRHQTLSSLIQRAINSEGLLRRMRSRLVDRSGRT